MTAFEKIEEGLKEVLSTVRTVPRVVRGFMCRIDFDHELGYASEGNRVYPSIDALKKRHEMWKECGIVEVEVRLVKIVEPGRQ